MSVGPEGAGGSGPRKGKRPPHTRAEFEAQVADIEAQVRATNARIEARTGRNLPLAILIGIVLGGGFLVSLIVLKEFYMVFAGVLLVFLALELSAALRASGRNVPRVASAIAAAAIVPASFYWDSEGQLRVCLGGILFVAVWRLAKLFSPAHRASAAAVFRDIQAGAFVHVYTA